MVQFGFAVDIACTPDEAFAYLADPANLREWQGTAEVVPLTPGSLGVGSRFREVHVVLGRRLEGLTEVTEHEPGRRFAVRVLSGPIPIDGSWELEPTEQGTRLHFRAAGDLHGPKRLLRPLFTLGGRRQMRAHHRRLKAALEARATARAVTATA